MRVLGTKVIRLFNQNDKTEIREQLPSFGPAVAGEIKSFIKSVRVFRDSKPRGFCKIKYQIYKRPCVLKSACFFPNIKEDIPLIYKRKGEMPLMMYDKKTPKVSQGRCIS